MRSALALVLVASLVAGSAWGAKESSNDLKRAFGTAYCEKNIPCGAEYGQDQSAAENVLALAKSCITNYFGFPRNIEHFEDSLGLDSNRCLTAKKIDSKNSSSTLQMVPSCCLVPMEGSEGMCELVCHQYGVR